MKTIKNNIFFLSLLVFLFSLGAFTACDNANDWDVDNSYDRLFRPSNFASANLTANTVDLTWGKIPGTDYYMVQISRDSLKFTQITDSFKVLTNKLTLTGLEGASPYSVRVRAVPVNPGQEQSKYAQLYFKTKSEQIMQQIPPGDRTFNSVTVYWTKGMAVSHISIVNAAGAEVKKETITVEEKTAGKKTITGLTPETSYTASIYNDTNRRGYASFRTYPEVPAADRILYLTPTDSICQTTLDTIKLARKVTFAIPAGAVYTLNYALRIPDGMSVTFFGLPGTAKPVLSLNCVEFVNTHEFIKFQNVDLTGIQYFGTQSTAVRRDYLFNQGTVATVDRIEFVDCVIRNFNRAIVRLKDTGAKKYLGKLIMTRVVAFDQGAGSYAFITCGTADGTINDIEMRNSTFYGLKHTFIEHSKGNHNSILIEDCTFNNIIGASRYLIDHNTFTATSGITINNTIFGSTADATAKGIRTKAAINVFNSYKTSDCVIPLNPIPSLTDYSGTAAALFTAPVDGNFTIKDSNFAGKSTAGAMQWRN